MNKKQIVAVIEDIVNTVAGEHGLEENEARTLVGIALKRKKAEIVAACAPAQEVTA